MKIVGFYHSLISDWNHGNAHFLRGDDTASCCTAATPSRSTSRPTPGACRTSAASTATPRSPPSTGAYPGLAAASVAYGPAGPDLDAALDGADLVLVHEWNDHGLVAKRGRPTAGPAGGTRCCSTTRTTAA